ncbi:MAG: sigma 54-dependent Fis family transcriptional regulator [Myxococcales bacterium]|nr:sigma 54-dependent Fis family transcriptional regulator [Myxococcales bacterium]
MTESRDTSTVASPRMSSPGELGVRIRVIDGAGKDRGLALVRATATIGRHSTCDLAIPDPQVSGVHLHVAIEGDRIRVRDAGSTNGTWLAGQRVYDVSVGVGAELTVGGTKLAVERDSATPEQDEPQGEGFGDLVGASRAMRELFGVLERIAPKELTVLLLGETGTGKEEVARTIHKHSKRADKPFVVVDCTALPDTLAESLLFGHEKGAFTGANERRTGFFEAAHGGTLFLDEVGELPLLLQSKFLRVLERREIVRVGSQVPVPVDIRVLAATNRDLRLEIDKGRFREDLYFRLAQIRLTLPALRDRPEDIPLLCRKLLERAGSEAMIEQEALTLLTGQPWPGNIRELGNTLLRASALAADGIIRREDLAGEGYGYRAGREASADELVGTFAAAKDKAIERFEKAYLSVLMRRCKGNLSRASREADVARHHLRDILKKRELYGLDYGDEE